MNILIIGNGGREHAIGWNLSRDERVRKIWFAPGNAGTAALGENVPIAAADVDKLAAWAKEHKPDLTVVGPEVPLCLGVVDKFEAEGLQIFGPNKKAAQLEGSKIFTKELLVAAGIPTARSDRFTESDKAIAYSLSLKSYPQVIKADGIAAGKGVIIAQNAEEAEAAIRDMIDKKVFGDAGREILIEEFLVGDEMSVHAVTDGRTYRLFPSAQDHKRVFENDEGPNTGGMGAYSPSPLFTPEMKEIICREVFDPLLKIFNEREIDYRGVLYAGLMMTAQGPKVLEFNARFGDPETQVLMPLLETPLLDILLAVVGRTLNATQVKIASDHAMTVVLASENYPSSPKLGDEIRGLGDAKDGLVFHAGTKKAENGAVVTAGGRVLTVTGRGATLQAAADAAYALVSKICFRGMHYRRDIGHRALKPKK